MKSTSELFCKPCEEHWSLILREKTNIIFETRRVKNCIFDLMDTVTDRLPQFLLEKWLHTVTE